MSDRIFAGMMLLFAIYYGIEANRLELAFAYDPLGPKAFPLLLSVLLGVLAVISLSREGQPVNWPRGRLLLKTLLAIATLIGYSLIVSWLGFILSTTLMFLLMARLFEATPVQSLVGGIAFGLIFYGLSAWLLGISLPAGEIFSR